VSDLEQLRALRALRRAFGHVQVLEILNDHRITRTPQAGLRRRQVARQADPTQSSLLGSKSGGP